MDVKIKFNRKVKIIVIDEDDFGYKIIDEDIIDRFVIKPQVR